MGFKEWMTYRKRKNLYILGAVILSTNSIVWTREIIGSFMSWKIAGTIDLGTLVGLGMLFGTYLFYQGKKLG